MIYIRDIEIDGLSIRIGERSGFIVFLGFPDTCSDGKGSVEWIEKRFGDTVEEGQSVVLMRLETELREYFRGKRKRFTLPVKHDGTGFQTAVWQAVDKIPYGKPATYSEIACSIGRDRSVRAVGNAIGSNMISILTPCHRVKGKDNPGGYLWGAEIKERLLAIERESD